MLLIVSTHHYISSTTVSLSKQFHFSGTENFSYCDKSFNVVMQPDDELEIRIFLLITLHLITIVQHYPVFKTERGETNLPND